MVIARAMVTAPTAVKEALGELCHQDHDEQREKTKSVVR